MTEEIKKLISDAKNICLIPSKTKEPESLTAALALFYTLKESGKNVNLIMEDLPEKFNFLIPSLDFISQPKNFVISIPRNVADVSQVYYEKNEENLKIHLTIDRGHIKKDAISFYFSEAKPDLVITLGIKDFQKALENKLDSFGFILDAPIVNIDNQLDNTRFGKMNIIEEKSLSEITLDIIKSIDENLIKKDTAGCLLTGLIIYYENFKSAKTNAKVFEIAAKLMERGASNQQIIDSLYKTTDQETKFLGAILQNLQPSEDHGISSAALDLRDFQDFAEPQINTVVEKIKTLGIQNNLLVLWKSHASAPAIKGFFYSKKAESLNKALQINKSEAKNGWIFLLMPGEDINLVKNQILDQLKN